MSTLPPDTPPPVDRSALVRELVGLALVVLGVGGLVTAAFLTNPVLGVAALSTAVLAVGLTMTIEKG